MGFVKTWDETERERFRSSLSQQSPRKTITYEYPERSPKLKVDVLRGSAVAVWGDSGARDRTGWRLLRSRKEVAAYFQI